MNQSRKQIKSSQGSPKTTGETKDEFIANIKKDLGMEVVDMDKGWNGWMTLDDGSNVYDAEWTRYSDGNYELMHYNIANKRAKHEELESSRKAIKAIKSSTYQFICEFDGKYAPRVLTYIGKDGVCGWGDYEEKSDDALSVSESELEKAVKAIVKNEDYDDIEIVKDNGDSVFVKEYLKAGSFDAAWKKAIEDEENEWKINSSRKSEASAWVKNAIEKDHLFDNISKLCSDLKAYPEDKLPPNGLYCKLISCKMELDGSSKLEAEKMCSSFTILNWVDHLDDLLKNF